MINIKYYGDVFCWFTLPMNTNFVKCEDSCLRRGLEKDDARTRRKNKKATEDPKKVQP